MDLNKLKNFIKFSEITGKLVIVPYGMSMRWCNNACEFCYLKAGWDKHLPTIEFFNKIKEDIFNTLPELLSSIPKHIKVELDFAGGEIFCVSDEYYQIYYDLIQYIKQLCTQYSLEMCISLSTNLLYSKEYLDKLIRLYKFGESLQIESEIVSSFDLWGRFKSKEQVLLWWNNILELADNLPQPPRAEMVLLKPSIDIFLKDEDTIEMQILDKILSNPDKCFFFLEDYTPNSVENIKYVPSNQDLIDFHKKLIDKYYQYNLELINVYRSDYNIDISIEKGMPKKQDCSSAFFGDKKISNWGADISFFDQETPLYNITNCIDRTLGLWSKDSSNTFQNKTNILKDNTYLGDGYMCLNHLDKVNNFFLNKFGCGNCKFKQYCYVNNLRGCYIAHNFIWADDHCWRKEVFAYMQQKLKRN